VLAALLFAAALAAPGAAADYPAQPVWDAYRSFCSSGVNGGEGWTVFMPEPNTRLAFLAADPAYLFTGKKEPVAIIFRKSVAGRTLFGLKRSNSDVTRFIERRVYDFEATERLQPRIWRRLAGKFSDIEQHRFNQRFHFVAPDQSSEGMIELRQHGMTPLVDDIGFSGLNLVAVPKAKEKL
jgi:hypothetical protein